MSQGLRVAVRPYREEDEDAVAALWGVVFPDNPAHNEPRENIRRKLGIQRELFLVAVVDGRLVGTALAGDDGRPLGPRHQRSRDLLSPGEPQMIRPILRAVSVIVAAAVFTPAFSTISRRSGPST